MVFLHHLLQTLPSLNKHAAYFCSSYSAHFAIITISLYKSGSSVFERNHFIFVYIKKFNQCFFFKTLTVDYMWISDLTCLSCCSVLRIKPNSDIWFNQNFIQCLFFKILTTDCRHLTCLSRYSVLQTTCFQLEPFVNQTVLCL